MADRHSLRDGIIHTELVGTVTVTPDGQRRLASLHAEAEAWLEESQRGEP